MALASAAAKCIVGGMKTNIPVQTHSEAEEKLAANGLMNPDCDLCGGKTRLTGIEPHPRDDHTDLRSYECLTCAHPLTLVVPLAQPKP
jgi:hypothetical protein